LALTNSQQVYQVVRKIIDDQPENGRIRLSVPAVYDTIKKSNSSLNRKPKRLIEDSLERVLEVVKADMGEEDEDSMEGDFEGLEEPAATVRYARLFCPNGTGVLI
jgi:ribosome biogenesis ATPase